MAASFMGKRVCSRTIEVGILSLANRLSIDTLVCQRFFHLGKHSCKPRKRYQWRKDKPSANTQLKVDGEEVLETRRTFGGRSKVKAVFKNKGSYLLKSQGIELHVPILDIVHSDSNKDHAKNTIMTKGAIVQIDGTEFKARLENLSISKSNENDVDASLPDSSHETSEGETNDSLQCGEIDEILSGLMKSGKLYGRITTRPGQVGLCDGYVLEGAELKMTAEKLSIDLTTVN